MLTNKIVLKVFSDYLARDADFEVDPDQQRLHGHGF